MATEYALLEVGVLFAAVALAGVAASRLGQSVIPFYILVGMASSRYVVGRIEVPRLGELPYVAETEFVAVGAELGIVFLLFFLGLEFNLDRLLAAGARIARAGTLDLVVNFGAGLGVGYLLFGDPLAAFLVAGIVYISSSAIVTKSLLDLGWIANDEAGTILGILVYEDLVIAVYLAVASALVLGGSGLQTAGRSVGVALGVLLALLLLAYLGTAAFERLLSTTSNEFLVLRTVGVTVLIAGAALALGVSEAVAAFFVGMAVSATDRVAELEELLEPVRDTFAAVFFFWIGLLTDPLSFGGVLGLVAVAVVVTTPTKLVSGFYGGRLYGLDDRRSTRVALAMTTRGEFSLIVAALALGGARLPAGAGEEIYAFAVGYVLVMSILGTTLMQYSGRFERVVESWGGEE